MKNIVLLILVNVVFLALLNLAVLPLVPKKSVFWDNELMVMYPVDAFDQNVTVENYLRNNRPQRPVRYVPDKNRWYRLDPEPIIPPEGGLILHFGDSSTWGWGLRDRLTAYPVALQEYLPGGVHSVNLGVPGYSSLQGVKYLEEMLLKYGGRVKAITLYFGNNDATWNGLPDQEKLKKLSMSNGQDILGRLPLYRLLSGIILPWRPQKNEPRVSPEEYAENMTKMIKLAHEYHIQVVVIEPPVPLSWPPGHISHTLSLVSQVKNTWVQKELKLADEFYKQGIQSLQSPLLQEALEHDWVMPRIKKKWQQKLSELDARIIHVPEICLMAEYPYQFEDYCHPSPILHDQIAQEIMKKIK